MTGRPRTAQELIHWLEVGGGARWVLRSSLFILALVLSGTVAWRQFHGAQTETTLAQADVARQLASGRGFTTQVNYPQEVAYLKERGESFNPAAEYPEVYQAPLYAAVLALPLAVLRVVWHRGFDSLFDHTAAPPDGFGGDYFLLVANVALFWCAVWLAYSLGRKLFGSRVGWTAAAGLFLSVPAWQQVVAVNGTALLMVLSLGVFHAWWAVESDPAPRGRAGPLVGLGVLCGLLFLAEYSAGALVLVVVAGAALRGAEGARLRAAVLVAAGFLLAAAPWAARNMAVTGIPVGLAVQNAALKAGDSTAEPAAARAALSAVLPSVNINKLANKALSSVQDSLRSRIWSGGAMWFTAFFVAGWLYAFRSAPVTRLRWLFTAALLVLIGSQAVFNSGESERLVTSWTAPLIIVFGAGFFFVLLGSHPLLGSWPRASAVALLGLQALPLVHDALEPRRLHFQYPPYFPQLFQGMKRLDTSPANSDRFGLMADVPAGLAWYGGTRAWAQPGTLRGFYAVQVEQPTGELVLTPRTLDRPFLSDLNARSRGPAQLAPSSQVGEWGEVYGGLVTGSMPREFPLSAPERLAENLYVLVNPALPVSRRRQ